MKNAFVMFCKTYSADLNNFKLMISSFNQFNKENIMLYVSVPEKDFYKYTKFESNSIKIITDESYAKEYFTINEYFGLSSGYINQEICKLSFWELNVCENYLCIDSDIQFIRDFYLSDFMFNEEIPYTILVMDKDLSIEKHYRDFWTWRSKLIKKIYDEIGLDDPRQRTCHGMQVLSVKVLKSLKQDFMQQKGYEYKNLIEISPYEFTWYNVWFQKSGLVKEISVEPFFKTFHMRMDYLFARLKLLKQEDFAKAYVGIILNSNWQKKEYLYKKPSILHKFIYKIIGKI